MNRLRWAVAFVAILSLVGSTAAQFGPRPPQIQGVWNPVVGSGAAYSMESKREGKMEMEFAIVGAETVAGKPGHWLEMAMTTKEGLMVMKNLMVFDGGVGQMKRMIMQAPGQPPMELPVEMMMRGQTAPHKADFRKDAQLIGTEDVTTPAGTFSCQHYRTSDGDVWFSEKVPPYGLVKMTGKDTSMVLTRVITNAKTKITGTPQKFDPMQMMQRP